MIVPLYNHKAQPVLQRENVVFPNRRNFRL